MTMVVKQTHANTLRLILSPNRSASWRQAKGYFAIFALPSLVIALFWFVVGAWLVLPFACIELLLLFLLFRYSNRKNLHKQVIDITPEQISITEGSKGPERQFRLQRPEAYLRIVQPEQPMALMVLSLADDEQSFNVGPFLNQDDRHLVKGYLAEAGVMVCHNHWWKK